MKHARTARGIVISILSAFAFCLLISANVSLAYPTIISPANGSNVGGTTVTFSWYAEAGATDYYFIIATDSSFYNVVYDGWLGNAGGIQLSGFPDNGQVYYWAVGSDTGGISNTYYFINGPSAAPSTPSLSSPSNGSTVNGTTVQFRWSQASRANDYYLVVATDSGFTDVVYSDWIGNYVGINLSGLPDNGQTFYWQVAANNDLGSTFSSTWHFKNGPSAAPATPSLSSPTNGSTVNGATVQFRWAQASRANDYYLVVGTDSGFTDVIFSDWVGNYTGVSITGFPDNGQTFWSSSGGPRPAAPMIITSLSEQTRVLRTLFSLTG